MAPCSGNVITPKMIRTGQVHIGDKIEFEKEGNILVSAQNITPAENISGMQDEMHKEESSLENKSTPVSAPAAEKVQSSVTVSTMTAETESGEAMETNAANTAGTETDNGITLHRQNTQNTAQIPLAFQQMTDYVNSLENNETQSPVFSVPSNPLVPPEYAQTIDYDSVQYMNGFLRTQIGRYMRVEQLIGAGTLEDRYGFLVGVGNNYLLLQDISNGNVSLVDIYTVKYVYIYFGEPVFPNLPAGSSGRQ